MSAIASPSAVSADSAPSVESLESAESAEFRAARRPRVAGELVVVCVLVLFYDRIRDLAQARPSLAFHDGWQLLQLERGLGIDVELRTNHWLAAHAALSYAGSWYYQVAHLAVTLTVLLYCYVRHPTLYRPGRNALVLTNLLGLLIFWCFPVAPPRLLPTASFVDITARTGVASASSTAAPNPYAAMPSLHTGWAIWVLIIGIWVVRAAWARLLLVLHAVLTVVVIVATGNHYLLDVLVGALVAFLAVLLAQLLHRQGRPADFAVSPATAGP